MSAGAVHGLLPHQASVSWLAGPCQKTSSSPASMATLGEDDIWADTVPTTAQSTGALRAPPHHASQRWPLPPCQKMSWRPPAVTATLGAEASKDPALQPADQSDGPFQEPAYQASWRCPEVSRQSTSCWAPSDVTAALGAEA